MINCCRRRRAERGSSQPSASTPATAMIGTANQISAKAIATIAVVMIAEAGPNRKWVISKTALVIATANTDGWLYVVTLTGTTGARDSAQIAPAMATHPSDLTFIK